jgi:hypothetical protein
MPGSLTSIPKRAVPSHFGGVSLRGSVRPISVHSLRGLRRGSAGAGSLAASAASSP